MFWAIFAYLLASIAIAGSAAFNAGWAAGLCAIMTSALFLVAAGGLKASLWWGDKSQKIAGPIVAVLLVVLAEWLSRGFTVAIFGRSLTGELWGWIGFIIGFVCTDRKVAGTTHVDRDASRAIKIVVWLIAILIAVVTALFYTMSPMYEKLYLAKLDNWTKSGANVSNINTTVVPSCGKLVLVTAGFGELAALILWDREEYRFRVDVCVKAVVNKTYPQPEFQNKKVLDDLCNSSQRTFKVITGHFGICDKP